MVNNPNQQQQHDTIINKPEEQHDKCNPTQHLNSINTRLLIVLLIITILIVSSIFTFFITRLLMVKNYPMVDDSIVTQGISSTSHYHHQDYEQHPQQEVGNNFDELKNFRIQEESTTRSLSSSSSDSVFHSFKECSYERILSNGIIQNVPIGDNNKLLLKDIPFGFGCKIVKLPTKIEAMPYATYYMSETNSDIFSPIKASGRTFDICEKYSNISCVDYFCYSNSSAGVVDSYKYEIYNYCQYCKNNREDFLKFHSKIHNRRDDAVVNDNNNGNECPAFTTFPSAFYCNSIQIGIPLYYYDIYYRRLRNPFMCYCYAFGQFHARCDSSLYTAAFDVFKVGLCLFLSSCLSLGALLTYVIPQIRQVSRVRKISLLNACSILLISSAAASVTVSSIMYAIAYLGEDENLVLSNMALAMNIFFLYYSMLPVLLTFDRIHSYLNCGEKRNCPKFKALIVIAFIILTISFVYAAAIYIAEFIKISQGALIILGSISYVAFAIPWIDNLILFSFLSYRLRRVLKLKTNVSFFKTKYFFQFLGLITLSAIAFVSCLSAFIARQFGRGSTAYQFSYYIEQVSQFSNYSTLLMMLVILYDSQLVFDCYKPIIQPFRNLLFNSKKKGDNHLKDSLLENDDPYYVAINDTKDTTITTTTTDSADNNRKNTSTYYVPPTSFVSESSTVSSTNE